MLKHVYYLFFQDLFFFLWYINHLWRCFVHITYILLLSNHDIQIKYKSKSSVLFCLHRYTFQMYKVTSNKLYCKSQYSLVKHYLPYSCNRFANILRYRSSEYYCHITNHFSFIMMYKNNFQWMSKITFFCFSLMYASLNID